MTAIWLWLAGSRIGRWCAIVAGVVLAVVTFGAWQRRQGAQVARQHQKDADHAAVVRADRADSDFRGAGGAEQRLRSGDF